MTNYTPDNWVVIKIRPDNSEPFYKILGGWSGGGYLDGDSWRMNSGITRVDDADDHLFFYGSSGSVYQVNKKSYGLRMNLAGVWASMETQFGDKVELVPEDTDWLNLQWSNN